MKKVVSIDTAALNTDGKLTWNAVNNEFNVTTDLTPSVEIWAPDAMPEGLTLISPSQDFPGTGLLPAPWAIYDPYSAGVTANLESRGVRLDHPATTRRWSGIVAPLPSSGDFNLVAKLSTVSTGEASTRQQFGAPGIILLNSAGTGVSYAMVYIEITVDGAMAIVLANGTVGSAPSITVRESISNESISSTLYVGMAVRDNGAAAQTITFWVSGNGQGWQLLFRNYTPLAKMNFCGFASLTDNFSIRNYAHFIRVQATTYDATEPPLGLLGRRVLLTPSS